MKQLQSVYGYIRASDSDFLLGLIGALQIGFILYLYLTFSLLKHIADKKAQFYTEIFCISKATLKAVYLKCSLFVVHIL